MSRFAASLPSPCAASTPPRRSPSSRPSRANYARRGVNSVATAVAVPSGGRRGWRGPSRCSISRTASPSPLGCSVHDLVSLGSSVATWMSTGGRAVMPKAPPMGLVQASGRHGCSLLVRYEHVFIAKGAGRACFVDVHRLQADRRSRAAPTFILCKVHSAICLACDRLSNPNHAL